MSNVVLNSYRHVPSVSLLYEQTTVNNQMSTGFQNAGTLGASGTKVFAGHALVGKNVDHMEFFMEKTGSPTGTFDFRIIQYGDSSGGTVYTPDKTDFSTISTGGEWISSASGSHTIVANDVLTAWSTNASGDSTNKISVMGVAPLTVANLYWTEMNYGWYQVSNYQGGIKVYGS